MKFLFEHEQTQFQLRHWAGGNVISAAFFFWRAGSSELEKSYLGLLRALLYQVLQERPELIELVFPQRWRAVVRSVTYKTPWTEKELVNAFVLLRQAPETNSRFCFFIDGLDEFDGDHRDLVDAIRVLGKSSVIKLCVSSRPWISFQREYGSNDHLHIALHTLTQRDIAVYITSRLSLATSEDYCANDLRQLGNAIHTRSEGVFLWVSLAVKDLRRGIDGHDSMKILYDRLQKYPSKLRDFIQLIFDSIDPAYKIFTGRLLLTMLDITGPPALISLNFFEDAFTADGSYILNTQWSPKTNTEMKKLIDRAAVCANQWCRDLLQPVDRLKVKECMEPSSYTTPRSGQYSALDFYTSGPHFQEFVSGLSFGHRSIHQFAEEEAAAGKFSGMPGHKFDHRLTWLYTLVELSRCSPDLLDFVEILRCASWLMESDTTHEFCVLAERDKTLADAIYQCFETFDLIGQNIAMSSECSHWTHVRLAHHGHPIRRDPAVRARMPIGKECGSFVSYLVCSNVNKYIVGRILARQYGPLTALQKQFVLEASLYPQSFGDDWNYPAYIDDCRGYSVMVMPDIIVQIIQSGIGVNQPTQRAGCQQDYSVWQLYLLWMHQYFCECSPFVYNGTHGRAEISLEVEEAFIKDMREIFRIFLANGADPFAVITSADLIARHGHGFSKASFSSVADVVEDLRTVATSDLGCFDEHQEWLVARLTMIDDIKESLDAACMQNYLTSSPARAASTPIMQPNH